jgi:hypothetical protein
VPIFSPEGFQAHVERLIREAMERGEFDDLPGEGKPLPDAGTHDDEYWWVRKWLARNRADGAKPSEGETAAPDE